MISASGSACRARGVRESLKRGSGGRIFDCSLRAKSSEFGVSGKAPSGRGAVFDRSRGWHGKPYSACRIPRRRRLDDDRFAGIEHSGIAACNFSTAVFAAHGILADLTVSAAIKTKWRYAAMAG